MIIIEITKIVIVYNKNNNNNNYNNYSDNNDNETIIMVGEPLFAVTKFF